MFSAGTLLFTFLDASMIFQNFSDIKNKEKVESRITRAFDMIKKKNISPVCSDLIHKLVRYKAEDRIKIKEVLKHPFITTPPALY
jgi:serine/threonine protein kinase